MRWLVILLPGLLAAGPAPKSFRDCRDCPVMVTVPAGRYLMGSPATQPGRRPAEGPQVAVDVAGFAIGTFPVTHRQWAAYVAATGIPDRAGCEWSGPDKAGNAAATWRRLGFAQSGDHPVVCVSWAEAIGYVRWLTRRTGRPYRLPSEAEWEYAARGGTTTAFPWGDTASHELANYGAEICCSPAIAGRDRWLYTAPVGSFPANRFGLHDMIGNVWQWTMDCWRPSLAARPTTAMPVTDDDCAARVARGGTWGDTPAMIRSASRNYAPPPQYASRDYRSGGFGLRVVAVGPVRRDNDR